MKSLFIAAALGTVLLASSGFAQQVGQTRASALAMADKQFDRFDKDSNGTLDATEIDTMLQMRATRSGKTMKPNAPKAFLSRNDGDANGVVSRAEFEAVAGTRFDNRDANKNGVIDADEAQAASGE
jgi:hypothetical protein